jgi:hypothetical protein
MPVEISSAYVIPVCGLNLFHYFGKAFPAEEQITIHYYKASISRLPVQ